MISFKKYITEMTDHTSDLYAISLASKVDVIAVPINQRAGDKVRGEYVMGLVTLKGRQRTLLYPTQFDAQMFGPTKKGEFLARLENSLSKVERGVVMNASIVKVDVSRARIFFLKDYDDESSGWDSGVATGRIAIHEPFLRTLR